MTTLWVLGLLVAAVGIWHWRRSRSRWHELSYVPREDAVLTALREIRPVSLVRDDYSVPGFVNHSKGPDGSTLTPPPVNLPRIGALSGLVFGLEYSDANGVISSRVIRLKEVFPADHTLYLTGHCYLRGDDRTFRVDRILRLIDHRSGASIHNPSEFFERFVDRAAKVTPEHEAAMNRARPGLKALLWLAHADRRLDEAEISALLDYIPERLSIGNAKAVSLKWDRDLARLWIENYRPTLDESAGALMRMSKGGGEARLFKAYAEKVVAADGSISDLERKRLDKLMKALI